MEKVILASGPVIVENGQVLLDKHGDTPFWKFCGGRVEKNENLKETAKREIREEMSIDIEIIDPRPFLFFTEKETPEGLQEVVLAHFLAKRIGEIKPGADIRDWQWLDLNNLPKDLAPNILPTLKHFHLI